VFLSYQTVSSDNLINTDVIRTELSQQIPYSKSDLLADQADYFFFRRKIQPSQRKKGRAVDGLS
jgi:hypothetical protein